MEALKTSAELSETLKKALTKWKETGEHPAYVSLRKTYKLVLDQVILGEDKEYEAVAVSFFVSLCETTASTKASLYFDITDGILSFLHKKEHLSVLTRQAGGDRALAWFACHVAATYARDSLHYSVEVVAIHKNLTLLLENWSGRALSSDRTPQLDVVVSHIYGDVCWEFLGCEQSSLSRYADREKVISRILDANVPLTFRKKVSDPHSIPSNLPLDLSI